MSASKSNRAIFNAYTSRGNEGQLLRDALKIADETVSSTKSSVGKLIDIIKRQQEDLEVAWSEVDRLRDELEGSDEPREIEKRSGNATNPYGTKVWRLVRRQALARSGYRCEQCGVNQITLYVHHVIPRVDGGEDKLENAKVLCPSCHRTAHYEISRAKKVSTL